MSKIVHEIVHNFNIFYYELEKGFVEKTFFSEYVVYLIFKCCLDRSVQYPGVLAVMFNKMKRKKYVQIYSIHK